MSKNGKMSVHLECYPCFLRQVIIASRLGTEEESIQKMVMHGVISKLHKLDFSKTPAHTTTFIHREIRNILGKDPFSEIKSRYNNIALGLYPRLKEIVRKSKDPLWTASRLAIAGNVIDFGIFSSIDIEGTIKRALESSIEVDDYEDFKAELEGAENILYLLDNTGEAVFDRIFIEELLLLGKNVTAVAKGAPVINDCTTKDAVEAGIPCEIIDNGSDAVGTIIEMTSEGFKERLSLADIIISKGQGNFETLLGEKENIYFFFQSKCVVVSKILGLPTGSMLLKKGG